jgi:nucleoside-diphosphate-sugar epimerase/putative sterol carrier protein
MTSSKKKKIAVTGGSGELGTLVVKRLCADRSVGEVVSLDVQPPATLSSKLRAITADVRDPDLERHFAGCDAVVHLAFIVAGWRPRAEFDAINVEGSKNVFRAAIAAGVKQLVYTSSVAAYGVEPGHPVPLVETSPRRLVDDFPYSAAKFRVEQFLDELEPQHPDVAMARLRPGILIGTHMENALGDLLRRGFLPDGGTTPAPLVWDEDVADAVLLCIEKGARGAFNVSADEPRTAAELARQTSLRVLKVPPRVLKGMALVTPWLARAGIGRATDPAWFDVTAATMIMSSAKARRELGWKPTCNTSSEVVRRYCDTVPRRLDPRVRVFMRLVALGARNQQLPDEAKHVRLDLHLRLTGPDGGDLAIRIDRGRMRIERAVPRPPTAVMTLSTSTFLDLLAGRTTTVAAGMVGKLRVEGEGLATMFLQGLFSTYRQRLGGPGPAGALMRRLDAWLSGPRKAAA